MYQHVYTVGRLTVESGAAEIHFSTPHVDFFDFDPPHRGGGGLPDTVLARKRHTNAYIKPNTGDGRGISPPLKTEHRGR